MNYEIIAIILASITGPGIAILTVYLEYRKDKKEKLQDRKDMWLDTHYKELYHELKKLIKFITTKDKEDYKNKLKTGLVKYTDNFTSINANMKAEINDIIKNYGNSLKHLELGYENYYNKIVSIFSKEEEYKENLNKTINDIFKCIKTLMEDKFPCLQEGTNPLEEKNGKYVYYNINLIYYKLVENIISNNVTVNAPNNNIGNFPTCLYFNYPPNYKIICRVIQDKTQINRISNDFNNYIWAPLNNKFKEKIERLNKTCTELRNNEEDIKNAIQNNIINNFKLGHVIEGYCDVCDKIYHETDITKLRPKL